MLSYFQNRIPKHFTTGIRTMKNDRKIYVGKIVLLLIICPCVIMQCSLFGSEQEVIPYRGPLQGMMKEFPDGSTYVIMYSLPDFFPQDIPVYIYGEVEKMYVYGEREMDIVMKASASIGEITAYYEKSIRDKGWTIDRSYMDETFHRQKFEFPLTYNNNTVDTVHFFAEHGYTLAASHGNVVSVCRIIKPANTQLILIIQHVRTVR